MKVTGKAKFCALILLAGIAFLGYGFYTKLGTSVPLVIAGIIIAICLIGGIYYTNKEKKEKFCEVCKRPFNFDEEISYKEVRRYTTDHKYDPSRTSRQKITSLTYEVRFDCKCAICGNRKIYNKKIDGGEEYSDGTVNLKDPEEAIEDYFRYTELALNDPKFSKGASAIGIIAAVLGYLVGFTNIFSSLFGAFGPGPNDILSATPYYGTYYGITVDTYTQYSLEIDENGVILTQTNLMQSPEVSTYDEDESVFYTASYMQKISANKDFEGCAGLVLDERYTFWITEEEGEDPTLTVQMESGNHLTLTTTPITLSDLTNDPKNYYGEYTYSYNNTLTLNSDGTAELYIYGNSVSGSYKYIYADSGIIATQSSIQNSYSKAIILYKNNTMVWFAFDGDDLLLKGNSSHCFSRY